MGRRFGHMNEYMRNTKCADQPAHSCSLISAFVIRSLNLLHADSDFNILAIFLVYNGGSYNIGLRKNAFA